MTLFPSPDHTKHPQSFQLFLGKGVELAGWTSLKQLKERHYSPQPQEKKLNPIHSLKLPNTLV